MFVERNAKEINDIDDADQYLQQLLEVVGSPVLEAEPVQLKAIENDGQKYGRLISQNQ